MFVFLKKLLFDALSNCYVEARKSEIVNPSEGSNLRCDAFRYILQIASFVMSNGSDVKLNHIKVSNFFSETKVSYIILVTPSSRKYKEQT